MPVSLVAFTPSGIAILVGTTRSALSESHFIAWLLFAVGPTEPSRELVGLVAWGRPLC